MAARLLSAFVALPVVIYLILLGGWPFLGVIIFASAVCCYEVTAMAAPDDPVVKWLFGLIGAAMVPFVCLGHLTSPLGAAVAPLLLLAILLLFLFRPGEIATAGNRMGLAVTGLLWAGGLMTLIGCLGLMPNGAHWVFMACVLAWGSDTGGYFFGRFLGKKKLYPAVSPKKTWAGSFGGIIVATAMAYGWQAVFGAPGIDAWHLMVIAPLGAALGQMGDLCESLLKRATGVKDSGRIMPGHGGLFDRVDALLFTSVWLFAYALIVGELQPTWL